VLGACTDAPTRGDADGSTSASSSESVGDAPDVGSSDDAMPVDGTGASTSGAGSTSAADDGASTGCTPVPYETRAPGDGTIFVHYGPGAEPVPEWPLVEPLLGEGEVVLVTRALTPAGGCDDSDADFAHWRDLGGRWAYKLVLDDLKAKLVDGTFVPWFVETIDAGWDYVAWDELRHEEDLAGDPHATFEDAPEGLSATLVDALDQLAELGYDRRFMVYFAAGAISRIEVHPQLMTALRDHGRLVMFERYHATSEGWTTNELRDDFERWSADAEALVPGINERLVIVLGIGNEPGDEYAYLDDPSCDLGPEFGTCGVAGMLLKQFSALHQGELTSQQPGVAAYNWNRVVDTAHYDGVDLAVRFRDLADWWPPD
jgi:hypothetical protein